MRRFVGSGGENARHCPVVAWRGPKAIVSFPMAGAPHQDQEVDGAAREHGPHARHSNPIDQGDRAVRPERARVNIALCAPSVAGTGRRSPIPALLKKQAIALSEVASAAEESRYAGRRTAALYCSLKHHMALIYITASLSGRKSHSNPAKLIGKGIIGRGILVGQRAGSV